MLQNAPLSDLFLVKLFWKNQEKLIIKWIDIWIDMKPNNDKIFILLHLDRISYRNDFKIKKWDYR